MSNFAVFQSMWGMIDLPREGAPWSVGEKLARIAEANFDGVEFGRGEAVGDAADLGSMARELGLRVSTAMIVGTREQVESDCAWAIAHEPEHITIQPLGAYLAGEEAHDRLAMMIETVRERCGLTPTIETHRDRLTQSLPLTVSLAESLPDLRFTVDLSHYQLASECAHTDREEFLAMIDAVLQRMGHIHGRVSNGEQIQIDIGDGSECPDLPLFMGWWMAGMRHWRLGEGRRKEACLRFVVELGPHPYSPRVVGPSGRPDGPEISNRWAQALVFQRLARECWTRSGG